MEKRYFKRKIDKRLEKWLASPMHVPAVVYGIRQCGKSESILHFAHNHFEYVNYIDFWKAPAFKRAFVGSLLVDDIIKFLSSMSQTFKFVPGKTVLVLDEIQDCPRARLALKSFKEDGRFEVIASGSYIGLNIDQSGTPKPIGAEDFLEMKTMDFEEFLWAIGYEESHIDILLDYFNRKEAIPEPIHSRMKALFNEYICVGGYPESVLRFVTLNSFSEAFDKARSLIIDIKGDPAKRRDENQKPLYTPAEISRIQKAFDLIAAFAVSDNRRFVASKINGNGIQRNDAVDYLLNASVAFKAFNVEVPSLPLGVRKIDADYKLFYADIGMLINQLGFETIQGVVQDGLGMNKGYLYEAVVADSLYKAGFPLYYFRKESKLEIDLVISYRGFAALIEAKAKTGNTKSSKTVMSHPEHYGQCHLIKVGDYNVSQSDDIMTIPHYLVFALGKEIQQ